MNIPKIKSERAKQFVIVYTFAKIGTALVWLACC